MKSPFKQWPALVMVLALGVVGVVAACTGSTTTTGGTSCGDGSELCGSTCTPLARDPENCGKCGTKCGAGEVCSQGACAASCGGGTTKCGSSCVDTKADGANCGACGTKCNAGEVCSAGKCAATCAASATQCGSSCVNAQVDPTNCGACGTICKAGEACSAGKCQLSCQAGLTVCSASVPDGGVADASSDAAAVDSGSALGSPYCANLQSDDSNCGACGTACASGQSCQNGSCKATCGGSETLCTLDGGAPYCSNVQVDEKNCGTCGKVCPANAPACVAGACQAVLQCMVGLDPLTAGLKWTVCSASPTEAWVSMATVGGNFHATAICKSLGYSTLGSFGGTCGKICGYCGSGTYSCSAPGPKTFDGAGNGGTDSLGQILGQTVMWQCLP